MKTRDFTTPSLSLPQVHLDFELTRVEINYATIGLCTQSEQFS